VAAVENLPGVAAVLPAAEAPTCLQRYEEGLEAQVASLHASRLEPSGGAATDPRITVYAPLEYEYVYGYMSAHIPVTLRIRHGARLLVTQTTTSNEDGDYSFYPFFAKWVYHCNILSR